MQPRWRWLCPEGAESKYTQKQTFDSEMACNIMQECKSRLAPGRSVREEAHSLLKVLQAISSLSRLGQFSVKEHRSF